MIDTGVRPEELVGHVRLRKVIGKPLGLMLSSGRINIKESLSVLTDC